ncbi:DapH/DapD/GlmU-related protein [Paraburkholderia humisilvae]|uniref:2,3,4,5-tetrahydropyridine-2,6-dicarboxylate N-acetyltransferase n=1 Tax=Paraburkholderia humisilvae TaxID=627669 RepID=A0A6J5ETU8_9BURK|nr:DapH/DapD/GlmU-related protein [Paraburkholderia humisilvae]CAB3769017.1 2,3,4,5-tetrahydropyridine-2,6-dicarboxylate N-acetyltransferase [Paraburkholderia humisilvae]
MLINHGVPADPWTLGNTLSENPQIHPTSFVRASEFGRYTYLGPRSLVAESVIGDYGYAMGDNQIAHARIGKFVNIATGARINPSNHPTWRATSHHFTYRSRSYGFALDDDASIFQWRAEDDVEIGHDVWLGHNSIVMPGVRIGTGAAVGSGAVVTKDVPPYAIVVGVPARVLRFRVDERTAQRMQQIAWWDWTHEQIDGALADFRTLTAVEFADKYGA